MAEERFQRRLTTILASDVVGYSRMMEADEAGTLAALKAWQKDLLEPLVAQHQGRIFKITGDGVLVEFGSAVNAVQCAVDLQHGMAAANDEQPEDRHIVLRIGINLGDVMVDGSDLYGDGVNIAARLEGLAEPGGILVSATVNDHVGTKVKTGFEDLGTQTLKNIAQPVRMYRVTGIPAVAPKLASNKASIAVLAFTNMSGDPEQEYFVDGLTEDLITDLSKVEGLFVISRHSSFAYKGKSVDIRSVAKDLGVRFVVEGSVRRAAARVRINVQLIDATDGTHVWADRFDRDLADVFVLQDEVVGRIVNALSSVLPSARPIARPRATNLEAYDLFVRGRVLVNQSAESNRAARALLEKSIELDPSFADAHAWLAMNHLGGWVYWGEADAHRSLALAAAERAVSLDPGNAGAHAILGEVLIYLGKPDAGAAELTKALEISPNHADAWVILGEVKTYEGSAVEAIDHTRRAFSLNPHPPGWYYWYLGFIEYAAGQYEDAVKTLGREGIPSGSQRILAASLAQLGRLEEATAEATRFLAAHPGFSIKQWANTQPFQRPTDRQHFIDGYLKAGLPQ
jgi:TolB-like protein/class 3 adenylate cyclase/Tfp pilus assembly protein PilF